MKSRISACCLLALGVAAAPVTLAHSPTIDALFTDWCFDTVAAPPDTTQNLVCGFGSETAWYDAEADNTFINDMHVLATTSDAEALYFAASLYNDPSPDSIPTGELAISLLPGGKNEWVDVSGVLPAPNFGLFSQPGISGDYLIVFDFANFLIGGADNAQLLESFTNPGTWTPIKFLQPAINPGAPGGTGGPPGGLELAIRWSDFACAACPSFGPSDAFYFTFMIARGDVAIPFFTPSGPIEDTISEEVAGTYTTTTNSCPTAGGNTTDCELADTSSDGFIVTGPTSGEVPDGSDGTTPLLADYDAGTGILTLDWDLSCFESDKLYEVYEGLIGDFVNSAQINCDVEETTLSFAPGEGDTWYLVVPSSGASEGSYGKATADYRAPSPEACRIQIAGECP